MAWSWSAGILSNAAFVGANTVKGPLPLSVSTNPAAVRADTSVLNCGSAAAAPTMVGFVADEVVVLMVSAPALPIAATANVVINAVAMRIRAEERMLRM